MSSPNLTLDYLVEGQASAEATVNDALNRVDFLAQCRVKDRDLTAPPGSPATGDRYIVGASATGAWSGKDGNLTAYYSGWVFQVPAEGMVAYVEDEDCLVCYSGSAWLTYVPVSVESGITASVTQTQGQQPLVDVVNHVGTCANDTDVVTLPAAAVGRQCVVINRGAQTLQVYPASGDKINGGSADASVTVASNGTLNLYAIDATDWFAV